MNKKLLRLAKEEGFYLEPTGDEEHYAIPMLERFAGRVLASSKHKNIELLNAAKNVIERLHCLYGLI